MSNDLRTEVKQTVTETWWIVLVRGIIAGSLGIALIVQPALLIAVVMIFMGAYWFVDGILTLATSIKESKTSPNRRWGIFAGIIGILAGLVVFLQPITSAIVTTSFLMYFLAVVALIYGFSCIMNGIRLRKEISNEWTMIFSGVVSVLFGMFLMSSPLLPMKVLAYSLGGVALISGIVLVVNAFRLRSGPKEGVVAG